MLTAGPNKGQTAGGTYGIVPNSLIDFIKQSKKRGLEVDPRLLELAAKPHHEVTKALNENRELDDLAGELGARLVLHKTGGDEEKAAFGWRTGHNRDFANLQSEKYAGNPYVKAYRQRIGQMPAPEAPVEAVAENVQKPAVMPTLSQPARRVPSAEELDAAAANARVVTADHTDPEDERGSPGIDFERIRRVLGL
jgi:hypothetical protein